MQIDTNILIAWGGVSKRYKKNQIIFYEDNQALFYYQIVEGQVKMINLHNDGSEFIQGIFYEGSCFGEPPLFIDEPYPCTAVAQKDSVILILSKTSFFKMLLDDSKLLNQMTLTLARRIYNKTVTARELIHNTPEDKILAFLKSKKKNMNANEKNFVNHTRQEIANLTGLRVETVIRTLKKMETEKLVCIINRKLYF